MYITTILTLKDNIPTEFRQGTHLSDDSAIRAVRQALVFYLRDHAEKLGLTDDERGRLFEIWALLQQYGAYCGEKGAVNIDYRETNGLPIATVSYFDKDTVFPTTCIFAASEIKSERR